MREFIVDVSESLKKGLKAFHENVKNSLMLEECHNFQVGEDGLEEYNPINPLGWQSYFFNYLPIRTQPGFLLYWYPVADGRILISATVPDESQNGLDAIPVSTPVEWVEILDEYNAVWKLYPDQFTGSTRATDSTPLNGTGLSNMVWRGTTGERWTNRFSRAELARYAVRSL
jgi:hypothetical protein